MNMELDHKQKRDEVKDESRDEMLDSPTSLAIELMSLENEAVTTDVTSHQL